MSFDLILDEIGEFGVWQVLVCGILWVPPMVGGIHVLMYSFTGSQKRQFFHRVFWLALNISVS